MQSCIVNHYEFFFSKTLKGSPGVFRHDLDAECRMFRKSCLSGLQALITEALREREAAADKKSGAPSSVLMLVYNQLEERKPLFPLLHTIYRIALTISVTSASCERSFSVLKLIKNHLRMSATTSRVTDNAMTSIHSRLLRRFSTDDMIDFWERTRNKRSE